jgi:hypothetical protein
MSNSFIFKTPKFMQCRYIKHDGSECHAIAMENSEYCWFHAPEIDYDRDSARSKGGKAYRTGIYNELPPVKLETIKDVPELLMDTIRQLRVGFIGPRIAATIGYLSGMLVKANETADYDMRMVRMERKVNDAFSLLHDTIDRMEAEKKSKK